MLALLVVSFVLCVYFGCREYRSGNVEQRGTMWLMAALFPYWLIGYHLVPVVQFWWHGLLFPVMLYFAIAHIMMFTRDTFRKEAAQEDLLAGALSVMIDVCLLALIWRTCVWVDHV